MLQFWEDMVRVVSVKCDVLLRSLLIEELLPRKPEQHNSRFKKFVELLETEEMTAILNFIDDNRSSGESFELFETGFMKRVQDAAAKIPILKSFPIFNDLYPFAHQDSWAGHKSRNIMLGVLSETIIKIVGESCFQTNTPIAGGSNASISTIELDHFEGTGKRGFEPSSIANTATGGIDLRDAIRVERIVPTANLAHNRSQTSDPNRRDNEHDRRFTWVPADPLHPRDDALQYSVSHT